MSAVALADTAVAQVPSVTATVNQIVPKAEKPAVFAVAPEDGDNTRAAEYQQVEVEVHDARAIGEPLSVDDQGFDLVTNETEVEDFYDDEEVTRVFYPEVEAILKARTGAKEVLIFDHTRRVDTGHQDGGRKNNARGPVRTVHNDYTEKSGPQRVRDLVDPADVDTWLDGRFAVVNLWRTIAGPVETAPLAIADARHMGPNDFVATDLVYKDRVGEIYDVAPNPEQKWYYVPWLQPHEALLIKCYDSATDGTARFTAHTAFDDPTTPAGAPPRESIEVRALLRF